MSGKPSDKREIILNAALREFADNGIAGARLQTIADNSGVTKAMIHYYFNSKGNLFNEVFREAYGVVMAGLLDILEADDALFKKIERFVDEATERFHEEPAFTDFIMNALNRNPGNTVALMNDLMDYDAGIFERQLEEAASAYEIAPVEAWQVILNMLSVCMFPYAGRRFMSELLNMESEEQYLERIRQRKGLATDTIINWLAS